ncbi:hypothetical protein CB1_001161005 [Camelus ferus]|nr:hypothetical protein CB1_001161005 [Camelus ferus]
MCSLEKNDGSQSDTAVGALGTGGKKRRSSIGAKMVAIVGLSRKSRSASQLSQTVISEPASECTLGTVLEMQLVSFLLREELSCGPPDCQLLILCKGPLIFEIFAFL